MEDLTGDVASMDVRNERPNKRDRILTYYRICQLPDNRFVINALEEGGEPVTSVLDNDPPPDYPGFPADEHGNVIDLHAFMGPAIFKHIKDSFRNVIMVKEIILENLRIDDAVCVKLNKALWSMPYTLNLRNCDFLDTSLTKVREFVLSLGHVFLVLAIHDFSYFLGRNFKEEKFFPSITNCEYVEFAAIRLEKLPLNGEDAPEHVLDSSLSAMRILRHIEIRDVDIQPSALFSLIQATIANREGRDFLIEVIPETVPLDSLNKSLEKLLKEHRNSFKFSLGGGQLRVWRGVMRIPVVERRPSWDEIPPLPRPIPPIRSKSSRSLNRSDVYK